MPEALRADYVVTGAGPIHAPGFLVHEAGRILAVGRGEPPAGVLATDAEHDLAGRFFACLVISRVPLFLFQAVQASLLPKLASLAGAGLLEEFRRGFGRLLTAVGVIGAAATVGALAVPPDQLLAWLGPAIGPQAFEVGEEVREAFVAHDAAAGEAFRRSPAGRWLADLYTLARQRLARAGVRAVYGGGLCTFSDPRFYSFRRAARTGRQASLVWLAP